MKEMTKNELSIHATDSQEISYEVSQPENGAWILLEQYGYIADFTITSKSDWGIESEGDWFVLYQTKGTGTSKIQMEIVANQTDTQREGRITIKFPQDEQKNQTINLRQKSLSDYNANDLTISEGYGRYGVGYGYDATGSYASSVSCKSQVFLVGKMIEDKKLTMDCSLQDAHKQAYTGSYAYDVSQKLSVNAGVEAKFGGFKGEVKASFDQEYTENQFCEFGIYSLRVKTGFRKTETILQSLKEEGYMAPIARKAIDGESELYKGAQGIRRLIQAYGTHVICKAYMGGRLDYSMAIDVSKINGSYDISAFLSLGYKGLLDASASADEKYRQSYETNKKNCFVKVRALGGGVSAADVLEQGEKGVSNWRSSLSKTENQAMVDFDSDSLIPIWELCQDKDRAEEIKQYVEFYVKSIGLSTCQVTKIDIPDFSGAPATTLIKTAVLEDGTPVAEICNEYITNLSSTTRVTVVYPILAGVPQYSFGFFVGSSTQRPGLIVWDGGEYTYKADLTLPNGAVKTIYSHGLSTSLTASTIPEAQIRNTTTTDQFYTTLRGWHDTVPVNHPLVKVKNYIWTRTALWTTVSSDDMISFGYSNRLNLGGPQCVDIKCADGVYMLYNRIAANALESTKWTIPSSAECNSLIEYVTREPSKVVLGGVSGLELALCGFWSAYEKGRVAQLLEGSIWCGKGFEYMRIEAAELKVGTVPSKVNGDNTYGFTVRLTRVATFRYY